MSFGGGGGGSTSTQVSGLPEEFKPYITDALATATAAHREGDLSQVAGLTGAQTDAFGRKLELGQRGGVLDQVAADSYGAGQAYRDAAAGRGLFGADALGQQTQALQGTIGTALQDQLGGLNTGASLGGTLGSARQQQATNAALTQTAGQIAADELSARRNAALAGAQGVIGSGSQIQNQFGQGVKATEGVGAALQQQAQNEADATYQGLQRLFGLYGSPAVGTEARTTTSGGGK